MNDLLRKSLALDVKALADDGTFEVYAATFGNVDRTGEVIVPGAFTNLDEFVKDGWGDVNHSWGGLGIATIDAAEQDAVGLKVRGRFHSTADAQAIRTKIRERLERGKAALCSIGYREIDAASELRDGQPVRMLKSLALYEFSFVNIPANPRAAVMGCKGLIGLDDAQALIDGVKSGRAISKANHAKLSAWAGMMDAHGQGACQMAGEMKTWLTGHKPGDDDGADAGPDGDPDDQGKAATRAALKLRSLQGRLAAIPA